jgi:DNA-binding transcriptional LysR family regulator
VDLGSLSRAARLLQVSQPALSKRLASLEALAGVRLLERTTRGVTPTLAGGRLYAEARRLLAQAEVVEDLMTGLADHDAPVRLAASHTIAEFVLPDLLVSYERRHERRLSVEVVAANSATVRGLVSDGRAEIGIAAAGADPANPGLVELPFFEDEIVVAVPRDHPWAADEDVEVGDLVRTPLVVRDPGADSHARVARILAEMGLELATALAEVGSTLAARDTAVAENAPVLLSLVAARRIAGDLVIRRVSGAQLTRSFAVVLPGAPHTLRPAARALVAHLIEGADAAIRR